MVKDEFGELLDHSGPIPAHRRQHHLLAHCRHLTIEEMNPWYLKRAKGEDHSALGPEMKARVFPRLINLRTL
jgi:hypothetical protein